MCVKRTLRARDRLNARDLRLIVINGYPGAAVVYNLGELNATIRRDGLAANGETAESCAIRFLPSREKETFFCVRLAPTTSPCVTRHNALLAFNDDNLTALARHDLKYRWPSFRHSCLATLFFSGTSMKYEFLIEVAPIEELRALRFTSVPLFFSLSFMIERVNAHE